MRYLCPGQAETGAREGGRQGLEGGRGGGGDQGDGGTPNPDHLPVVVQGQGRLRKK